MDDGGRADESLKGFLLMAKSTKGGACAALIKEVLEHPSINVFGELLEMPNVQELAGTSNASSLELLKVFAFGTWSDYTGRASELPALSASQTLKLKKLTVVALASVSKVLEYDTLMRELEVRSVRELEDLLIDCMYTGLLQGRLDQEAKRLDVISSGMRDVNPTEIPDLVATLTEWHRNATGLMGHVSGALSNFKKSTDEARKAQVDLDAKVEATRATLRATHDSGDGFGGGLDVDSRMEYDGDEKMRKSGRLKSGRHVGTAGKHSARM